MTSTAVRGADFSRADFSFSDLTGADLRGARLIDTDFRGANLAGADLGGATIRGAKGLREELFTILERFQRNFELIREHKDEPIVNAFWNVLTKYDTLTSVYVNAPQIIAGFQKLLPGITS